MEQNQIDLVKEDTEITTPCGRGSNISSIKMHESKCHLPDHAHYCPLYDTQYCYNLTKAGAPACYSCESKLDEYLFYSFSQHSMDYNRGILYVVCSHLCPAVITDRCKKPIFTSACYDCGNEYIYARYDNRICPTCKLNKHIAQYTKQHTEQISKDFGDFLPAELLPDIIKYCAHFDNN